MAQAEDVLSLKVLIPFYSGLGYYVGHGRGQGRCRSLNPFLFRAWLLRMVVAQLTGGRLS